MREIPDQAVALLRVIEGCSLVPYKDSGGLMTIGIGHLILPHENFTVINQDQAEELLKTDMQQAVNSVLRLITRPLTDNQYSALLCFTFNVGGGSLQRSTLRMKCNRHDDAGVMEEFFKWNKVKGMKVRGLTRRRIAEAMLYGKE